MFRLLMLPVFAAIVIAGCASYSKAPASGYYDTGHRGQSRATSETRYHAEKQKPADSQPIAASAAEPVLRSVAREESFAYADEAVEAEYESGSATGDGGYSDESYGVGGFGMSGEGGANYGAVASGTDVPDRPDAGDRMVVYRAEVWASVDAIGDALKNIEKLTGDLGGRIDSVSTRSGSASATIVLRVPAEKFDEALKLLERIGEITGRRISADDVTEAFRDTELRLKTQKMLLARFEELLKKAADPKERVGILREIERISAEIAALEQRLAYLRDQADFSSITLYLTAAVRDAVKRYQPSPFRWLRALGPDSWPQGKFAGFVFTKGPEGFFAMCENYERHAEPWLFQSPQGAVRVRLTAVENYPKADDAFWADSLTIEMGNRLYKPLADEKMGAFATRTYEVPGERRYLVGFTVRGDEIFVVEAVFDTTDDHAATIEVVRKFIGSVEVKP